MTLYHPMYSYNSLHIAVSTCKARHEMLSFLPLGPSRVMEAGFITGFKRTQGILDRQAL